MLPTDFGNLRSEHAELAEVFDLIQRWITANRRASFLDSRRLIAAHREVDPIRMTTALSLLVASGILSQWYGVIAPTNHVLAPDFFESVEDIPYEMFDSAEDRFRTDDADVIPIFRANSHVAADA
jgi:hypothetical protein